MEGGFLMEGRENKTILLLYLDNSLLHLKFMYILVYLF